MNIFSALAKYAQNKIGKLMYNTDGNAYLYDTNKNEFKDITIYPQEKFRPNVDFDWKDRGQDEKIKKWKDSFDNIHVYSVKVGEEVIDKEGNILERESEPNDSCPPDNTWADMIDDAYEGDLDARWNTD